MAKGSRAATCLCLYTGVLVQNRKAGVKYNFSKVATRRSLSYTQLACLLLRSVKAILAGVRRK